MQRLALFTKLTILSSIVQAQDYSSLSRLDSTIVNVYYSPGFESRSKLISSRMDKAMAYYEQLLDIKPCVTMLVLSEEDWSKYTDMPVVGMPHYRDDSVLVVAAHDNAFWKSTVPPLDQLPPALAEQIRETYTSSGKISMQAFFDLLALHELGHAFHIQGRLNMQRKWMQELFVNMLLHTYIAEKEPEALPALTIFPQMMISKGTEGFLYTSLKDLHEKYEVIGKEHPNNYGWYQCRWHAAAEDIYDAEGINAVKTCWKVLKNQSQTVPDNELIDFFENAGMNSVAELVKNWDRLKQ